MIKIAWEKRYEYKNQEFRFDDYDDQLKRKAMGNQNSMEEKKGSKCVIPNNFDVLEIRPTTSDAKMQVSKFTLQWFSEAWVEVWEMFKLESMQKEIVQSSKKNSVLILSPEKRDTEPNPLGSSFRSPQ